MRAIKNVTSSWNWPNLSASNCCTCPPTRPTSISSNACGNSSRRIVCTRPITTTLRSSNRPSHPVSLKLKPHTGPPSTPCFPTVSRPLKNQKLCQGRVYKDCQYAPGDYEAIISQRPIAVHALENPTKFDAGLYVFRKMLRDALRGLNPAASPGSSAEWLRKVGGAPNSYCCGNVLDVPEAENIRD